ncbi:MAG: recombinase family protein [Cyanobium sp.]
MTSDQNSPRAIGYVRVSTHEQHDSGLGLAAQRAALTAEAERRGWSLEIVSEVGSGKSTQHRDELLAALDRLDRGDADVLVVSRLDRLARSVLDFATIRQRAERRGWSVVALDVAVDTSTPSGALMASVVSAMAEYERRLIAVRTAEALARLRAEGRTYCRERADESVRARIVAAHAAGESLNGIARALNDDNVPTTRGGARWYAATVRRIVVAAARDGVAA